MMGTQETVVDARRGSRTRAALVATVLGLSAALAAKGAEIDPARRSICSPLEVRTVHGGKVLPNARLQAIEGGTVPCVHVEELTVATCRFSTAAEGASGRWVESPEGDFALVGQAISRDGTPGGEWIVAASRQNGRQARCSEPSGRDTAGLLAEGRELAQSCLLEDVLTEFNAASAFESGAQLLNYAGREVCFANPPGTHPDYAEMVRSYSRDGSGPDDVFCYTGTGAVLNDINGTERDSMGEYWPGERYCHFLVVAGHELPGAKRPATLSLPAPGRVNDRTIMLWRPVNPNVDIAN